MSVWTALFWGAFSSASLYLGEALAGPMRNRHHATGLVMGFGAGTLLSAVAYELVPESTLSQGFRVGLGVLVGALAYFVGDRLVDRGGGADRQKIGEPAPESSGAAMFVGALLDGVPESFILGGTVAGGGSVSLAFVAAVFVSNIPQGVAGTTSLQAAGYSARRIFWMWTALTVSLRTGRRGRVPAGRPPDQRRRVRRSVRRRRCAHDAGRLDDARGVRERRRRGRAAHRAGLPRRRCAHGPAVAPLYLPMVVNADPAHVERGVGAAEGMRWTPGADSAQGADMTARGRTRIRLESAIALLAAFLGLLTLLWKDWIEVAFRVDPDGHSGAAETGVVVGMFAVALILGFVAGFERHRARAAAAQS